MNNLKKYIKTKIVSLLKNDIKVCIEINTEYEFNLIKSLKLTKNFPYNGRYYYFNFDNKTFDNKTQRHIKYIYINNLTDNYNMKFDINYYKGHDNGYYIINLSKEIIKFKFKQIEQS